MTKKQESAQKELSEMSEQIDDLIAKATAAQIRKNRAYDFKNSNPLRPETILKS